MTPAGITRPLLAMNHAGYEVFPVVVEVQSKKEAIPAPGLTYLALFNTL